MRAQLADDHGIDHVTLQIDHVSNSTDEHCADSHGPVHSTGTAAAG